MAEDLRGTEILGFRIIELLGEGGMASVWKAEHTAIERTAAIKFLDLLLARDSGIVERFRVEANLQSKLQHPNIVAVQNFSLDPLAMVMEFVDGRSLAQIISHEVGPIPLQRALPYMRGILAAVEHAHDQGVVHRDLKPSNVMVAHDGAVKVTDFGIAKVLSGARVTRTGATLGTAVYMSPEQIRGKGVDARSDIYSLGITFYEMLAGRPPFTEEAHTDSDFELKTAHVNDPPPDPRQFYKVIPQEVVSVVLRALAKTPSDRYQDAGQLREALEVAARSEGGRPRRPSARTKFEIITPEEKEETEEQRRERLAKILFTQAEQETETSQPRRKPKAAAAPAQAPSTPKKSMSNSWRVLLAMGLMMIIGVVWTQWGSGSSEAVPGDEAKSASEPQAPAEVEALETLVRSIPSGARIRVDGKKTEEKTPAKLTLPTGREVTITFDLQGRQLTRWRGTTSGRALNVRLKKSMQLLDFRSRPTGAHVSQGMNNLGPTPLKYQRRLNPTRAYTFVFRKPGYFDARKKITGKQPWARKGDNTEVLKVAVILKRRPYIPPPPQPVKKPRPVVRKPRPLPRPVKKPVKKPAGDPLDVTPYWAK